MGGISTADNVSQKEREANTTSIGDPAALIQRPSDIDDNVSDNLKVE